MQLSKKHIILSQFFALFPKIISIFQKVEKKMISIAYCRSSYVRSWELVKSIVGTKFRSRYLCLHSQARNRP